MAGEQAERWRYAFRRRGTSLATTDTLGAATAVEHRATVVARIVRHYPMPEVPRLELPKPQR